MKKVFLIAVTVLSGCSSLGSEPVASKSDALEEGPSNRVGNWSMETDLQNHGTLGSASMVRVNSWAKFGTQSVDVTTTGASDGEGVYNGRYAVDSGKTYYASVWIHASTAGSFRLNLDEFASGGPYVTSLGADAVSLAAGDTKQLMLSGAIDGGASMATLSVTTTTASATDFQLDGWYIGDQPATGGSNNSCTGSSSSGGTPPAPTSTTPPPTTPPTTPPPTTTKARFCSASSNWNTPIGSNPALSPRSAQIVSALGRSKGPSDELQRNMGAWTVNVANATTSDPKGSAVNPDGWTVDGVPIPANATGTNDADGHLVIIAPWENRIYNFYQANRSGSNLSIGAPGVFRLDGPCWWNPDGGPGGPWTGRSSNASLAAGLILPDELKAGEVPHALALGMDIGLMEATPVAPALTTDGAVGETPAVGNGVPNGTRFQLDPSLNLDTCCGLGPQGKILAKAMQVHGAFVVERTSGIALYFQSTQNMNGADPYAGMDFSGVNGALLQKMRVIAPAAPPGGYDHPGIWSPPQPHR